MNERYYSSKSKFRLSSNLVKNLPFTAQMTIWGIRLLASAHMADLDVTRTLINGFKKCNAVQAGSNLLFLMEVVFDGLKKDIVINCACYPKLSRHESNLLDLFALSQHSEGCELKVESLDFLIKDAAINAIPLFYGYSDALKNAGLLFPILQTNHLKNIPISNFIKNSTALH